MGWEQPPPTKLTPKRLIMSFGKLKEHCKCRCTWRKQEYQWMKKMCQQWQEEQFVQAAYKRNTARAAQEALHQQAHWQREAVEDVPPD